MTKESKTNIQVYSAIAMLIAGTALSIAGFIVPPTGEIHSSVLNFFAECLIYAGSIFGITIYMQTKFSDIVSYFNNKFSGKTTNPPSDKSEETGEQTKHSAH